MMCIAGPPAAGPAELVAPKKRRGDFRHLRNRAFRRKAIKGYHFARKKATRFHAALTLY
jgi:hypothetical protein